METRQLQAQEHKQQLSTEISKKIQSVAKVVWRLDMIMAFPLDDLQIQSWANTITRLCPDVEPERVAEIVDKFLTGEWAYDKDQGIANIIWHINNPSGAVWNP